MPRSDVLAIAPDGVLGPHVTTSGSEDVSLPRPARLQSAPQWTARAIYSGVDDERVSTSPSGLPGGASEVILTPSTFSLSSLVPAAACTDGTETPCESPGVGTPPSTGGAAERAICCAPPASSASSCRGAWPWSIEAREDSPDLAEVSGDSPTCSFFCWLASGVSGCP